jgi:NusA-like KH domain protein
MKTIDMRVMRYLNLFEKYTRLKTRYCFMYNETIFFCVPKQSVARAIGSKGENIRKISETLRKKIKVIPLPSGEENAKEFIENIVNPVTFKELEITEDELILTAGSQSKAALIGRNKRRLLEMQKIVSDYFNKGFKIV